MRELRVSFATEGGIARVLDNVNLRIRAGKDGSVIRRRRECLSCRRRFTTYERVEEELPLVVKRDGRREPFDRQKILTGVLKACEKRPVSYRNNFV